MILILAAALPGGLQAAEPPAQAEKPAKAPAAVTHCVFPDYKRQNAPPWVCGQPAKGLALSAVGFASQSKSGAQHVKELAVANARLKLARQLDERVVQRANRHATANGVSLAQAGRMVSATFEKKTQEVLVGSRIIESTTSRRGTIYVLVGLDATQLRESVIATVKAGIAADPTPWKPLLAGSTEEQLAERLAAD